MAVPKILFVSWHFYMDGSNGASISTRELLHAFSQYGWNVKTICGPCVDNSSVSSAADVLQTHGVTIKNRTKDDVSDSFEICWFNDGKILSALYLPKTFQNVPDLLTGELFLQFVDRSMKAIKPDIVITYGGYWTASRLLKTIHNNGAKSVFMLHNFAYPDKRLFDDVDLTIVPSQFAKDWYKKKLNISTVVVPPLIRNEDVVPNDADKPDETLKKYVLYVNPSYNKGVFFFAKLLQTMAKTRADIPFLVIESCATRKDLLSTGVDLRGIKNLNVMTATARPSFFYRHAKITIVPSFFEESFARVAAESMINGIPTIASDRGALPETLGDAGSLFSIDPKYTPQSRLIPNEQDVQPWINEIIRLWDDPAYYAEKREKCLHKGKQWSYSNVFELYVNHMERL